MGVKNNMGSGGRVWGPRRPLSKVAAKLILSCAVITLIAVTVVSATGIIHVFAPHGEIVNSSETMFTWRGSPTSVVFPILLCLITLTGFCSTLILFYGKPVRSALIALRLTAMVTIIGGLLGSLGAAAFISIWPVQLNNKTETIASWIEDSGYSVDGRFHIPNPGEEASFVLNSESDNPEVGSLESDDEGKSFTFNVEN